MSDTGQVITRFAPSPTGFLHIGGARTALFNWLFARHHGGKFLLRIEDTDRERSTDEAIEAIFEGMKWLGLEWDDEPVFQFAQQARHREVAEQMLASGHAYHCYCSPDELTAMREKAKADGRPMHYDGTWRDRDASEAPEGIAPVIRFKAPKDGKTTVKDIVQGDVTIANEQLDDLILVRSDGTPTYMLSVVVDDHDMGITHIVRGDDHLTNAARQILIYQALEWPLPEFAHVPLIHGPDGAKLSKRHGALGVEAYRDMGYLADAMRNYLVRLGWSHGNDEIFSTKQAIDWFNLDSIGKSPARFDFAKLEHVNGSYIKEGDDAVLVEALVPLLETVSGWSIDSALRNKLLQAMPSLKERAKTLLDLGKGAEYLRSSRPIVIEDKLAAKLTDDARAMLGRLSIVLSDLNDWTTAPIEACVRGFMEAEGLKFGQVGQPLRAALTGTTASPGLFDVLATLGKDEAVSRINDQKK